MTTVLAATWFVGGQARVVSATGFNAHGLFIRTEQVVPLRSLLQIEVLLPTGPQRLIVVARFCGRSIEGVGVGCELFVASDQARQAWTRYLQSANASQRQPMIVPRAIAV